MINGIDPNLISKVGGGNSASRPTSAPAPGSSSFADALKNSIDEVSRLQQDASKAVEDLAVGKKDDVGGVMSAVEKSDLAFQTLLAIRNKLMDAYDEIKNISV
ncbi:MAG TPA: flagellar hook-basal body complex protein FliE [Tepidisphaeraceae bacterium]|nr:flagellar hook-basal body complex protein FliE [Tepidisphaeraceae bacterium]